MKIAQVAPLYERVPPRLYGGTERVVAYLTDELVALGHDVTLFASGDSLTNAQLVSACPEGTRLSDCHFPLSPHIIELEQVAQLSETFDIIHFHVDSLHLPLARRLPTPSLTTLHGRLDFSEIRSVCKIFGDLPFVSISNAQRAPVADCNFVSTVYHGLPTELYQFHAQPGDYVLFLGRISPEKGPEQAIEIAARAGYKLKIAAKVDDSDRKYFENRIRPLLRQPHVEFLGEVGETEKGDLLGRAQALLFPICWPEPFGLVMIEALACGTPVIAFRSGSVPEIIDHGKTGFIVETVNEAVQALGQLSHLSRRHCRRVFDQNFTANCMARHYLEVYQQLIVERLAPWPQDLPTERLLP